MEKLKCVILMLFFSLSGFCQDNGLVIQKSDCNSIVVNYKKGNKYGGNYILEKEIVPDVWKNVNRTNAKESRSTFKDLPNGRYRINMVSRDKQNIHSKELSINCTEEHDHVAGFHISPNPVTDKFSVCMNWEATSKYQLSISNYEGKEIMQQSVSENNTWIDANRLDAGLYILSIYKDGQLFDSQKLVIQ
jgi:hypothetical protein